MILHYDIILIIINITIMRLIIRDVEKGKEREKKKHLSLQLMKAWWRLIYEGLFKKKKKNWS